MLFVKVLRTQKEKKVENENLKINGGARLNLTKNLMGQLTFHDFFNEDIYILPPITIKLYIFLNKFKKEGKKMLNL